VDPSTTSSPKKLLPKYVNYVWMDGCINIYINVCMYVWNKLIEFGGREKKHLQQM
jgi:hypothetical protein